MLFCRDESELLSDQQQEFWRGGWKDLNPRMGASYDLCGNGRTALKVSLGRYVGVTALDIASPNNPLRTSVNTVSRTWNDANTNYVPDCDLSSTTANGECGVMSNGNFGKVNIVTRYADDVLRGFGARDSDWDLAAELHHELRPGLSVTGGYYRNWFSHFRVTDSVQRSQQLRHSRDQHHVRVTVATTARGRGSSRSSQRNRDSGRPADRGQRPADVLKPVEN